MRGLSREFAGAVEVVALAPIFGINFDFLLDYPEIATQVWLYQMTSIATEYISVGGNRHPSAADWDRGSGVLAFGADNNVALWRPPSNGSPDDEIYGLLSGHSDKVSAVKFLSHSLEESSGSAPALVTGSVDNTVRIWQPDHESPTRFGASVIIGKHEGSVNAIAIREIAPFSHLIAAAAADGTVKVWRSSCEPDVQAFLLHTINLAPRYLPLAVEMQAVLTNEDGLWEDHNSALLLAVGGTRNAIQIFVLQNFGSTIECQLQATLTGHEGWIRSLALTNESFLGDLDMILASASQDKYIRLWRFHEGEALPAPAKDPALGTFNQTLSNKAHWIKCAGRTFSITFEALLLGVRSPALQLYAR